MKKALAGALSLSLFLLAPGFHGWAAAAGVVTRVNYNAPTIRVTPNVALTPGFTAPKLTLGTHLNPSIAPNVVPGLAAGVNPVAEQAVAAPQAILEQAAAQLAETGTQNDPAGQQALLGEVYDGENGAKGGQGGDILPSPGTLSDNPNGLTPSDGGNGDGVKKNPPPPNNNNGNSPTPPSGRGPNKAWNFVKGVGRAALAAGAVVGLQHLGAALLPAVFGLVPVAAVWAVSGGVLLLPVALYARYRLARRDSPALDKTKAALDLFIGAYIGGLVIAVPSLGAVLASGHGTLLATSAAAGGVGWAMSRSNGVGFVDMLLSWAVLAILPPVVGALAAGPLGLGAILAMGALPAMATVSFFLGKLINSAETGQPFTVPGGLQKIRFPSWQWVMTGVTFALLTGYGAVYSNIAFLLWTLFGNKTNTRWDKNRSKFKNILAFATDFNVIYAGLLLWTAAWGFASPLTFLVLAFAPERAAHWTERLLMRFFPGRAPSPSTKPEPQADDAAFVPEHWPAYRHWLRTGLVVASIAAAGFLMGTTIFGFAALWKAAIPAVAMAAIPLLVSNWLVKKMMKAEPANPDEDPEFFTIMAELREKINAKRRAQGKKEIPMPELVSVPMDAPNAFATGRSPFKATVGQTYGIKTMLLDPETARAGLVRLLGASDPNGKAFRVFRKAIARSVSGVTASSTKQEVAQAVLRADEAQLKALGYRMLRAVHAHEFSHVMDRHMLTGALTGAMSSAIAFAAYGVMWAVGHVQAVGKAVFARLSGRGRNRPASVDAAAAGDQAKDAKGVGTEALDPISTGLVLKSLPALLKMFAALWAPVLIQIVQLAGTRNNEGQADEDGALLSEDPEALAVALGLLITWRPSQGFLISAANLPLTAATAHMFTVNSLDQLNNAGALPKLEVWGAEKGDNFLFDLFTTHPDTRIRIERLHDMSEAMRDGPPANGPPLAKKGEERGPSSRAWFRVLSDKDSNREFWKYTLGHSFLLVGAYFHYTALPKLAGDSIYKNRAANWAAQGAASLSTGPFIDRHSVKGVLVWTQLGRALLALAVPILFFNGFLGAGMLLLALSAAGFLQSMTTTAGAVAFNRILGDSPEEYNRANSVYNLVTNIVGVAAPLLAGGFISLMDAKYGLLSGNALSYGVYALALLGASVAFGLWLKIPRDDLLQARAELAKALKGKVKGVSTQRAEQGRPETLVIEVSGEAPEGLPTEFKGYAVKVVPARRAIKELVEGFVLMTKNRFLRLTLLFSTLSIMAGDVLVYGMLSRLIQEGFKAGAGAFGILLAASSLGLGLSAIAMIFVKGKNLERQGKWSSIVHGLGWLSYLGVFFAGNLWVSAAFLTLASVFHGVGMVVWSSLTQKVMMDSFPSDMGKVYSSMYFYQLMAAVAGLLLFSWLAAPLSWPVLLTIVAVVVVLCALADFIVPWLIFPIKR
jgi:Zn-dependent protease with chaperone function/MFS family permease